ncbi:hypothetical protein BAE44_0005911 [Dichanthelium oligosanthes]|uniref:Uncharacterized protein n=1 Tax=Dichanthelium oligosanthes TaxID=888268 RepID=A0A1E5W6Q2_9POAL|nr:hypothetical protein BAE44_0005911 [Dichanthelium oligosanthes]
MQSTESTYSSIECS